MTDRAPAAAPPVARILVVNPNTNVSTTEMLVSAAGMQTGSAGMPSAARPVAVIGATAASGPAMIVEPGALAGAVEPTVQAALAAMDSRPHAVIVAAFGDPGADELREQLPVPVVGIGQAALLRASAGGQRFAVVTSTPLLQDSLRGLVERHCPDGDFAGIFFSRSDPVELAADPHRNIVELNEAIDAAVRAGAHAVVIGGGPLSDAARVLAQRTDVAVIEPVPSAVQLALELLDHGPRPPRELLTR